MSYFESIFQNVVADPNNSSALPLNAGLTFTGTATSTLGVAGLQVSLKTDTNCQVYVEQSPDGNIAHWDIVDSYNYYASIGNFGLTIQAVNSYVRVVVTNTSTTNQTYLRLQTCLCPIVEAVPRSLDEDGHLNTAVRHISDKYGFEVENTPNNEQRSITPVRLVGHSFGTPGPGNVPDPNFWVLTGTTTGTVLVANNQCILRTNADNAVAYLQSHRTGRYIGGHSHRFRGVIRFPDTGTIDNYRRFGAFTTTDGAFFEFNGTTFRCVTRKTSGDTPVSSGAFNGLMGASFTPGMDIRTYEIYWNNSKVYFAVDGLLLHTFSATATTWADTCSLPARVENVNTNHLAADIQLNVRNAVIHRLGPEATRPLWKHQAGVGSGVLKYGPGTLQRVVMNASTGTTITLYDALSAVAANTIAVIDPNAGKGSPATLDYHLDFYTGLYYTTAGAVDVTIIYE